MIIILKEVTMLKKVICMLLAVLFFVSCTEKSQQSVVPALQKSSPVPINPNYSSEKDKPKIKGTVKRNKSSYFPLNFDEQKAVWVSYIDLQSMLLGKSGEYFRKSISEAYAKIKELGCNTVYVHVRSFGDAYYKSELFPWTKGISGEIAAQPDFDPLEIMVSEAHGLGLSFHAWINPMRCETDENMAQMPDKYKIKQWYDDSEKYAEYLVKSDSDNHYWLNPAIEEVRNLIADGAGEIVKNYDVDGIHIDDYFYPTTDPDFDKKIYAQEGGGKDLSQWRKENVSLMVKGIHDSVKAVNGEVLFGVSPQGNMENNYEYMYADVKQWCGEDGYIDYIVPQIYFGFKNSAKPFESTAAEWSEAVTCKEVKLIIGLGVYKISQEDEFWQDTGIIGRQIEASQKLENYGGFALYNYINLFAPDEKVAERTNAELKCIKDIADDN